MRIPFQIAASFLACAALAAPLLAQSPSPSPPAAASLESMQQELRRVSGAQRSGDHQLDQLQKSIDDVLWYLKLQDVARIDKVRFTSKPVRMANPTGQGAGNPMVLWAYTFVPRTLKAGAKAPLLVLVHGGVHADFSTAAPTSCAS